MAALAAVLVVVDLLVVDLLAVVLLAVVLLGVELVFLVVDAIGVKPGTLVTGLGKRLQTIIERRKLSTEESARKAVTETYFEVHEQNPIECTYGC